MADWYRSSEWSEDIAAEFEKRLARARKESRAQYLALQGYALFGTHPAVAATLLERAVEIRDEFQTGRALAFLALARFAAGDVDGGLDAYEQGLEWQLAHPAMVAVNAADYLFAVGNFRRKDRLPLALPLAEAMPDECIFGPDPQFLAAKALVYDLANRSDEARTLAAMALPLFAKMEDVTALGVDVAELRARLAAIAEA